jgi:hypothetical protein
MRRVMVALWGPDASVYSRRAMTLYRDPTVTWGGMEVGGIRISHMSHIDKTTVVVLTATKKSRKPFTVSPLATLPLATPQEKARAAADRLITKIAACETEDELHEIVRNSNVQHGRNVIKRELPDADEEIARAITAQGHELNMGSAAEPVT